MVEDFILRRRPRLDHVDDLTHVPACLPTCLSVCLLLVAEILVQYMSDMDNVL